MKRNNDIFQDRTMRDISTAVRKFCLLTPELNCWKAKYRFVLWIQRLVRSGNLHLVKEVANFCTRLVLETKSSNPRPHCSVPRFLRPLIRIGRRSVVAQNGVISIFATIRMIRLEPLVDVRTISAPFKGDWPDEEPLLGAFFKAARTFLPAFGQKPVRVDSYPLNWVVSWAAGPNGRPAWDHLVEDVSAAFSTKLGDYITYFLEVFPLRGREQLKREVGLILRHLALKNDIDEPYETISKGQSYPLPKGKGPRWWSVIRRDACRMARSYDWHKRYCRGSISLNPCDTPYGIIADSIWSSGFTFSGASRALATIPLASSPRSGSHSRLSFISDKGGKTRVIALGDLTSQSLLRPVHKVLFKMLARLETDGTFDQDKQRERVRVATKLNSVVYSVDMSACTDRLPAIFQMACLHLSGLLTKEQSLAWYLLITKRTFTFLKKGRVKHKVHYSVGQPMGFYSSWAVMAFSHHILVRWASILCGLESFKDYAILGDDIVIWNSSVGRKYVSLLARLGVDISENKSFKERKLAEFAKSYYCSGWDLKPIPASVLVYRQDFGPAMLVEVAKCLLSKRLVLWPWLSYIFPYKSVKDISTILATYEIRGFLPFEFPEATESERFLASVQDTMRQSLKGPTCTERKAYEALLGHYYYRPGQLDPWDRLWMGPLKWGVLPWCGPARDLLNDYISKSQYSLWAGHSCIFHFARMGSLYRGDNFVSWKSTYGPIWEEKIDRKSGGILSLDSTLVASQRFKPYAVLSNTIYKYYQPADELRYTYRQLGIKGDPIQDIQDKVDKERKRYARK